MSELQHIRHEVTVVTPEMARGWIDNIPAHQRRFNLAHATRLAAALKSGSYLPQPQPFILDTAGALIDGQHRAQAIVMSGVPMEAAVVTGADPGIFGVIDIGQRRTAAQFVNSRHSSVISTAARFLLSYDHFQGEVTNNRSFENSVSIDDIMEKIEVTPQLMDFAGQAAQVARETRIHAGTHLALLVLVDGGPDSESVSPWLTGVLSGADLPVGDPRLALRSAWIRAGRALNSTSGYSRRWALLVKAWNAYIDGRPMVTCRWQEVREAMPKLDLGD